MVIRQYFIALSFVLPILVLLVSLVWTPILWLFLIIAPLILVGIFDLIQTGRTLLRIYPVIGHLRYFLEMIRPEIQQYFVESDLDGRPLSREFRSLVYQRAKGVRDTRPFGSQFDFYRPGCEWVNHSLAPTKLDDRHPRVKFGGPDCTQPYLASPLNISAMSYGALSKNAIMALNLGAKLGNFAHNTGEGGLSQHHLENGGDLIWQIGTGYFGCRNIDGGFDAELFHKNATKECVKMIEIKLSQGAKPGHGGILPAAKLTKEIAQIRHVPLGEDVISPAAHTAFSNPLGLLEFVSQLRELSGGKPVGFKLCIGQKSQFIAICKAMVSSNITPDFITVDGSEGGTGAAPVELTNSVGTPMREGVSFVHNALIGFGLRDRIRIIGAGKVLSAFHLFRVLALGADAVNSARAMMLALGCIQSRACNTDHCPTGIATQDPARYQSLDVETKGRRVRNYQNSMVHHLVELLEVAGLSDIKDIRAAHVQHRVSGPEVKSFAELYPDLEPNSLLVEEQLPEAWKNQWQQAQANAW